MKVVDIVGARPQFIKLAPLLQAIDHHNEARPNQLIEEVLIHTGQHYDYEMSNIFFEEFGLKNPDYHLCVGSGAHGFQTGEMLKRIEKVLLDEKPDVVMVYGDTNTTIAGALAAAKLHIPVAHVEAGLRSFNKHMPEEINRGVTDHISDLLFCPTETAVRNLQCEGIMEGVHLVGDVMHDAVLQYTELAEGKSDVLERLGLESKQYALGTVHRAENTDDLKSLKGILVGLAGIAQESLPVIFPIHPRTRKLLSSLAPRLLSLTLPDHLRFIALVSYLDMLTLEKHAKMVLTDSGGVQKEAFFFGVPCFTLREETEWVETANSGCNVLVGCEPSRIIEAALKANSEQDVVYPYGDGQAAARIVGLLERVL